MSISLGLKRKLANSFVAQAETTASPDKGSTLFGNTFSTPASVATSAPGSQSPTPPKSNLFGAGGGAAVFAPSSAGGGLFSNLKPTLSDQKDLGEEDDSPKKPTSGGLLFGAKASETQVAPAPKFLFGASNTASTPERSTTSGGLFGSASKVGGDQTWQPGAPIRFGASTSAAGSFGSTNSSTAASKTLFGSNTTSGTTPGHTFGSASSANPPADSTTGITKPTFSFGGNSSTAGFNPAPIPRNSSYEPGLTTSGISTPGALSSDQESSQTTAKDSNSTSNEPSDEVRAEKTDLSGPGPGEENEEVLYSVRVAVYVKDDKNIMRKVAVGASRVLKDKTTGKARFLVRTEQGKVCLNIWLQKQVDYRAFPEKKFVLIPDFAGEKPKMYTVRTKDGEGAKELGRWIEEVKC